MIGDFPVLDFSLLLILFIGAWEFWHEEEKRGASYINDYTLVSGYFLFFALVIGAVFDRRVLGLFHNFEIVPVIALVVFFGFVFLVFKILKTNFKPPTKIIKKYPGEIFGYADYRYMVSKSSDIVFQQTAIVLMVLMFQEAGLSLIGIIVAFAVVFGFLHLPLIRTKGKAYGLYFIVASIFSAIFFPILITQINYGFIYSYMVHWTFYLISGSFIWLKYGGRRRG